MALTESIEVTSDAARIAALEKELKETYAAFSELALIQEKAKEIADKKSLYDTLTGLPNRDLFDDRLEKVLQLTEREQAMVAVLVLKIDHFEDIVTSLGFPAGDEVLLAMARRLERLLRRSDSVTRLSSDEFAIALPTAKSLEGIITIAGRILSAMEEPFEAQGHVVDINVFMGAAFFPEHGHDAQSLMKHANLAMIAAKKAGRPYEIYEPGSHQGNLEAAGLACDLKSAIESDGLLHHFQPIVDMKTGALRGVECLLRWQHKKKGLLRPYRFAPAAERTAIIKPLTLKTVDLALEQIAKWREDGLDLDVSVNISGRVLKDEDLPGEIEKRLRYWDQDPARVTLEISDSAFNKDIKSTPEVLRRLRGLGVGIAVDDFGTGQTSMGDLRALPLSTIKMDMVLVQNITNCGEDLAIVRAIMEICNALELGVVAKGVETRKTWDTLAAIGCHSAQGYYVARAMAADDFMSWLGGWQEDQKEGRLLANLQD